MTHSNTRYRVWPGRPYPLGATWDGSGVNFALFSQHAQSVTLCLFDPTGQQEVARLPLPEYTNEIWHAYLPDLRPGQLYGYRVDGPYRPEEGHRFNSNKLLMDPYARGLTGELIWNDALFGYVVGSKDEDTSFDERDSASYVPKCRVIDNAFTWGRSPKPETPMDQSIIYELHPRGFTMLHPDIPQSIRGTFRALARPEIVDYLRDLGITAIELLPIHAFVRDRRLVERGLTNYWGYNSIGFFAPDNQYLADNRIEDFKTLVQVMHDAGIEVILDVVYNHTAEGNHMGPTLSFRGIDNASYYSLMPDAPRYYQDFTGTGNSLELLHPQVLRMVTDSLRYWTKDMQVDGFRFDLATTLARVHGKYEWNSSFFNILAQDPVLSSAKIIAEPWDTGPDGYQLGNFPPGWSEWNDKYRDTVRSFWKGDAGKLPELASRLSGSADLYNRQGRRPWASINFVTAHDGFTLHDLVSYNEKHNEANGEDNKDGNNNNLSWNFGVEGPTDSPRIQELRFRQMRNFLGTLLLSQGVPMITAGDEIARSQNGNNNPYCQDNRVSWMPWEDEHSQAGRRLLQFTRKLIRLRQDHVVLRRSRFFHGQIIPGTEDVRDVTWLTSEGRQMTEEDWHNPKLRSLQILISGEAGDRFLSEKGEQEPDDTFLFFLHAGRKRMRFTVPELPTGQKWHLEISSAPTTLRQGKISIDARSFALYRRGRA
ncbi:MAG: glycogen debranching protein GlgX [Alkalispirochaeta sp.]